MKKTSEYTRFMSLTDEEKDREVAKYDREIDFSETRPLSAADRRLHAKARKTGRPKIGQGCQRVQVTMERGLLSLVDTYARKHQITRSQLFSEGVRAVISRRKIAG